MTYFVIYFSGGHVNPAVSLAMSVTGRLKWRKLPVYLLAQLLGGFVGAAAVFGVYHGESTLDMLTGQARGQAVSKAPIFQ